jgi:MFS family permease
MAIHQVKRPVEAGWKGHARRIQRIGEISDHGGKGGPVNQTHAPHLFGQRRLQMIGQGRERQVPAFGQHEAHNNGGFVLLPMVLCSMLGSVGAGRLLNAWGARRVVLAGFVLLAVGYGASAWPGWGWWGFVAATMPVGLGVGVVVGGALRSIAIDEAPLPMRGAAQGLVNIFTSVGTLMSATVIGTVADFAGGGGPGLLLAYAGVAVVMVAMALATLALRAVPASQPKGAEPLETRA